MNKTVIIYGSKHHGNTYKLVEAIANEYGVDLIDAEEQQSADLSEYDYIGFASGIDFGRFYVSVEEFIKNNLPENKNVFFIYTCAKINTRFVDSVKSEAILKGANLMGEYGCKGYNTYGPWKMIGGMNKNHPDENEINEVLSFFKGIFEKEADVN